MVPAGLAYFSVTASGYTLGTTNGYVTVVAGQDLAVTILLQPLCVEAWEIVFTYPPSGPGQSMQLTIWITGPLQGGGRFILNGAPRNDINTPPTNPEDVSISGTTTPTQVIKIWDMARRPGVYHVYISQWAEAGVAVTLCNTAGLSVSLRSLLDPTKGRTFSRPTAGCTNKPGEGGGGDVWAVFDLTVVDRDPANDVVTAVGKILPRVFQNVP